MKHGLKTRLLGLATAAAVIGLANLPALAYLPAYMKNF